MQHKPLTIFKKECSTLLWRFDFILYGETKNALHQEEIYAVPLKLTVDFTTNIYWNSLKQPFGLVALIYLNSLNT